MILAWRYAISEETKMRNPKEVFTEKGFRELEWHLYNLEKAIFFLTNNADDLHIGCYDEEQIDLLYKLENMLEIYRNGDGEKDDD